MATTREEHIKFCKKRAIAELDYYGNNPEGYRNALTSMASDLGKHPETRSDTLKLLCIMNIPLMHSRQQVINFINGFN